MPSMRAVRSRTNVALSGGGVPEAFLAACAVQKQATVWTWGHLKAQVQRTNGVNGGISFLSLWYTCSVSTGSSHCTVEHKWHVDERLRL